jgi:hypothetical protein
MAKKKKRARAESESQPELDADNVKKPEPQNEVELVHEAKKKKKKKKQNNKADNDEAKLTPTVSIAVPGSIIDNAQSLELATRVPLSLSLASRLVTEKIYYLNKASLFAASKQRVVSYFSNFFFFGFLSWLVRLLVPQPFSESMRFD